MSLLATGRGAPVLVAAVDPASTDPQAILRAATDRATGSRMIARMKMSIKDSGGTRERTMAMRAKSHDDARKLLILIEQPADVHNTGFLSIEYRSAGRASEQWLYLPRLHRVSRVPSSGKSDAFVGSDFSLADLAPLDSDRFVAKLLEPQVDLAGEPCWVIEAKPRDRATQEESGYERIQFWVSKPKGMVVQLKGVLPGGKRIKYFKASDIRRVDGIWTAYRMQMRTLEANSVVSETLIEVLNVDNSAEEVSDGDFTQQRLERGL
jgi:hypothetical protein